MKPAQKGGGSSYPVLFLGAVLLVYAIVFVLDPDLGARALAKFMALGVQVLPALALVFLLLFAVDLSLKPAQVARALGREAGVRGWMIATGVGVVSTGPVYLWFPLLADLRKHGMRPALAAAFLYCRSVKLPLVPLMIYYFGWAYTIVLTLFMFGFSVVVGLATEGIEEWGGEKED
ncbi:uncharacterized membrane protein YraQ (UPF0718 family) [Methanofollis sp. W23]|uniref:hypothetical protein n=1 Tax=Methanofollis sp. W23 TaxID=2817849 RepID=UPI001AE39397|nr:hypothetical protein [Methanofollis sp. W23]MBP2146685.1 uncharacterized membrane protein YraQ (UPF0718 family) [Methanofollis sp. W23]